MSPPSSASELAGADWRLVEIDGSQALPADSTRRPWLRFEADSLRVSGHMGCNRVAGPFTAGGDRELRFGALISTRMACAEESMNAQETALGAALAGVDNYRLAGDTLELRQAEKVVARFTR